MELEERIKRLESNNRLMAIGLFALVAVIAALVTALAARVLPGYDERLKAQADQFELAVSNLRADLETGSGGKVVKASEFQVVDGDGKKLARLYGDPGNGGGITFFDGNEKPKAALGVVGDDVGLVLGGVSGDSTLGISLISMSGLGGISTYDGKGTEAVRLGATAADTGFVATYDGKGTELVTLSATEEGNGIVSICDGNGTELVMLGGTDTGDGTVFTYNGKGTKLVELGATVEGQGTVSTHDGKGTELVQLGATVDGEGAIATFNRAGEVKNQWP